MTEKLFTEEFLRGQAIKKVTDRLELLEAHLGLEWSESNNKYYKNPELLTPKKDGK